MHFIFNVQICDRAPIAYLFHSLASSHTHTQTYLNVELFLAESAFDDGLPARGGRGIVDGVVLKEGMEKKKT